MERYHDALEESVRAVSLDPVSAISHNNRAMLLWRARRWDEAIEQAQVALDLDPSHVNALWWQGLAYAGKGDDPRALASLSKGLEASGAPALLASLGYANGVAETPSRRATYLPGWRTLLEAGMCRHPTSPLFMLAWAMPTQFSFGSRKHFPPWRSPKTGQ